MEALGPQGKRNFYFLNFPQSWQQTEIVGNGKIMSNKMK